MVTVSLVRTFKLPTLRGIMKDSTIKMLKKIDEIHDWRDGQSHSNGGTTLYSTDICRVCSLSRHYFSDSQNGIDGEYTFTKSDEDLSLREVYNMEC